MTNNIETTGAAANIDPYDVDVSAVDTSFPVLSANTYELAVAEITKVQNNAQTGENIKMQLKTTSPGISTTGEPIPAGFIIHHNISLTPTEKYREANIAKSIASFAQSAGIQGKVSAFMADPSLLASAVVTAKVGVKKATDEYPEGNKIVSFLTKR
jgi:hypothetical protein